MVDCGTTAIGVVNQERKLKIVKNRTIANVISMILVLIL
jgi:hypothetical protein